MKTIVLSASLAVLAAGAAQLDPQGVEQKKYVAFGMEYTYLTPQDFVDHADQFMKTPLDGVGVVMNGGKGTPRAYQCFRWILNAPRWTREQFRDYVEPLRKMSEYPCFKESFLWSWYPPKKRLDWTDDEAWNIASNNLRVVAWLAREGRMRGISFDIEDYTKQKQLFRIPSDPPYDELVKIVRRRAQDVFRGLFEEYPDMTVFMFWLLSDAPYRHGERDIQAVMRERGDLWWAFVNGMLDVMPPTITIVDGEEDAYKFEASRRDYHAEYLRIFNWDLPLVAPENRAKYLTQVSPSFGQYLDMYINGPTTHWYAAPVEGSRLKHLERNVRQATSSCGKYVWFWSEKGRWTPWSEELRNDLERLNGGATNLWEEKISGGFTTTLKAIKDPDRYFLPLIENAIAGGGLKDMLGGCARTYARTKYQRTFPGVKKGNIYLIRGWIRSDKCTSVVTYRGEDGFGLFSARDLLIPGPPETDGWRKVTQFITVPETAKDMHVTLLDEYRDFALYDISAYDGWRRTDPEALKPRIEGGRFKWSSPPAKCALSFHLAGAPGFVTLDVQTNAGNNVWISVGKDAGTTEGEINRVMEPGGRYTAVWTASESFPKMPLGIPRENPNNLPPDNIRAIVRVRP